MVTRDELVACARGYIGTRWRHQGRVKGVGVDCLGLVICVARDLGLARVEVANYSRYPDGKTLVDGCLAHMRRVAFADVLSGDVLVMTFDQDPQHVAFASELGGRPAVIHCYADARCVVEHDLDTQWRGRVRDAFRIPGVE
jgi:hypothetical protein